MKLKNLKPILLVVGITTLFTACQKESADKPATNDQILGTWKFVGMTATRKSTIVAGTGANEEKIITYYGAHTKNNAGTITLDATNITSANLTYSMDTVVNSKFYLGGVLVDEFDDDFTFILPLSSGVAPYKAVGTDSLYFSSGFMSIDPNSTPTATLPGGARISWSGDTLMLKSLYVGTRNQVINGVNARVSDDIYQLVKLKK
jgi:hypothetical protein